MKRATNARGTAVAMDHVSAADLREFAKTNTPCRISIYKKNLDKAGIVAAFRGVFEASGNGWCIDKFESRFPAPSLTASRSVIPDAPISRASSAIDTETQALGPAATASPAALPTTETVRALPSSRAERALIASGRTPRAAAEPLPVGASRAERALVLSGRTTRHGKSGDRQ